MKTGLQFSLFVLAAAVLGLGPLALPTQATTLALPFNDHMVLQRNFAAPVWGTGDAAEKISVTINGQTQTATTGGDGKWQVKLNPMTPGGPYTLTVQGKDTLTIQDVMVGEVWVASGQSNMDRTLGIGEGSQTADLPNIRYLKIHPGNGKAEGQWTVVSPATAGGMSITAFYFARELQAKLGVPVGVIIGAQGSTFIQRWWDPKVEPADAGMKKGGDLFNAYLGDVIPYGIKGAIWYQGEADTKEGFNLVYHLRLPALIKYWRRVWQQPDLPFYIVQLSTSGSLQTTVEQGNGGGWPVVRNAQRMALALPHTALAVTIDLGDGKVHPGNMAPFGVRLCLPARALLYGETNLVYSGPLYESMSQQEGKIVLRFSHVGGGLVAKDGPLKGFAIAGDDNKWVWANAQIQDDTILVSSAEIAHPTQVRYAWASNPLFNLYNAEGLPASPFTTSDKPPVEDSPSTAP